MIVPISKAPKRVPTIEPTPPKRLIPPIALTAIESRARSAQTVGSLAPKVQTRIAPTTDAEKPEIVYTRVFVFTVLIPESLVASSLPPIE